MSDKTVDMFRYGSPANKYLVIPFSEPPFLTADSQIVRDHLDTDEAYIIDMDKREAVVSWDANGWIRYERLPLK
jgi:hypothetical protein